MHIAYSQSTTYPKTKRIGKDSVVIITVDQADKINDTFNLYKDSIALGKKLIDSQRVIYDSLLAKTNKLREEHAEYKWKYQANREVFIEMEKDGRVREKLHEFAKLLLIGIIILQFGTISSLHK